MKITSSTTVADAMKVSKKVTAVFKKYNLDCPGCKGSAEDTVAKVAQNNGLDMDAFLKELKEAAEE